MAAVVRGDADDADGTPELPPQEGRAAWLNVFGSFLAHFVVFGNLYSFSLLVTTYADKYDTGRAEVSLIYQLNFGMLMGGGFFTGRLSDRHGVRPLIIVGTILYVGGFMLASVANALWLSVLAHGVLVGAGNACIYWPAVTTIPMWFDKRRALALGLAVVGSGVGNFVVGVTIDPLLSHGGLDFALQMLALYSAVFLVGAGLCLKRRLPNVKEQHGFCGDTSILQERTFQLLIAGGILFQMGFSVPLAHLAPYVEDLGFPASTAGLVVGMVGVGSAVGRVLLGYVADKLGRLRLFKALTVGTATIVLVWFWCTTEGAIFFFAITFGFMSGGFIALLPAVCAEYVGVEKLGSVMGFVAVALVPGSFLGPYYAGELFDTKGSYDVAIFLTAALLFLASLIVMFLPSPEQRNAELARKKHDSTDAASTSDEDGSFPPPAKSGGGAAAAQV